MVMPSATGMAMMPEETASLAAAAVIMAAVDAEIRDGDSACMKCELRGRKPGGESCPAFFPSVIKIFKNMLEIGATGFEPATSRPPAERATKLRHTPGTEIIIPETGKKATGKYRQKHTEKEKDPQIPQVLSIFYKNRRHPARSVTVWSSRFFLQPPIHRADHKHCGHHKRNGDRQGDPCGLYEARDDVGDEGHSRRRDRIRKLGRHMVYMFTLGSGGCHDRRVGDWRTVVTADSSCHAGRDRDDHEVRVAVLKYSNNDRDQDSEGSPGGSRRESQKAAHNENDRREEI